MDKQCQLGWAIAVDRSMKSMCTVMRAQCHADNNLFYKLGKEAFDAMLH